ncbi:MAG: hypothetical protein GW772_10700 [Flavobacteriia bacterium]|nr:hypothetical protein [Flavobacteriia bacterium]OIP45475.1 MAG: hypothetical protein AUK46_11530 [Flavobacteriaceae bacterium CG2_30_31_66]PIV97638.1 MAG: hypothetical protein COW43_01980 [Flavobacteriaceae bacterium CG17_big_fil_post_rev_8_21_14_2_50_31_13]PIX11546.1 MAG: hypothetical protein COZ74_13805 [Flavobacteriaceae bacterium CG_4_8_14_3_um_filter_31_8]PIY14905.1 MAG: hypothetical protein COZ16_06350 [Flavobacteriaceae bacterium CG_4_10_14_3_um_filter_31_253]PIZ11745.1 MAG: hypotheti
MFQKVLFFAVFFLGFSIQSQTVSSDFRTKTLEIKKDSIQLDSVAINPQKFLILDSLKKTISANEYTIDFSKALLIINSKKYPIITVSYFRIPDFITKIYSPFDESRILPNTNNDGILYSLTTNKKPSEVVLFEGLQTRGFITRGITSGNNQNAVTNASLDLEISGKLSENTNLRAKIFDTNIPIQQNGYSQNLTDFDRIFIEMYSKNWRVKAGDIALENTESMFMPINKQIAGLQVEANINENFKIAASGAVVRGKFNNFRFTAVEGNQGPYKLFGANNEAAILIIEGSEKVFVNGAIIKRGENQDYVINYNLGEIIFNTRFPITNDMRIVVEFQYAERNYTRFVTFEEASYKSEKFAISGFFYSENDAKNQPLQQSLTNEQKEILANAGNNTDAMFAESAFLDRFDANKILYKKTIQGTTEIFEYSQNPNDELYFVSFSNVGQNNGDYQLDRTTAIGSVFVFVGVNQGDFSPIIKLIPPNKFQTFVVKSDFAPSEKTKFNTEIAISNNDNNLFSSIDDNENVAVAATIGWQQTYIDKKWQLKSNLNHQFVQRNFLTIQRWEPIEFNREWNILTNLPTKNYFQSEILLQKKDQHFLLYKFENLKYTDAYKGNKNEILAKFQLNNTTFSAKGSFMTNTSTLEDNSFYVAKATMEHRFKKSWVGGFVNFENNSRKNVNTNQFVNTSHRFKEYESYIGLGDTTKIFAKIGVNFRNNDSIKSNQFTEINNRKTLYIDSKLIKNTQTNLSIFANYRITQNNFTEDEKTLNSRVVFNQKLFDNFVNLTTIYETSSGNVARQDYVYVKTEPGLGFYTWIDYNEDGIQDFNEFEIALFQDQAEYLRLPKPNLRFIATQRASFQQTLSINPKNWAEKTGLKKWLSHFYNNSFLTIENEQERVGNSFQLNPFDVNSSALIGLNYNFKNSLYYHKDLQNHSVTFTYGDSQLKQQYFIGSQENKINLHQLDYAHKFSTFWLIDLTGKLTNNDLITENFDDRNYEIDSYEIEPKISFLYSKNNRFSAFYQFKNKQNTLQNFEQLQQQKFGIEYFYLGENNNQISANVTLFLNDFQGNVNSPVAYQMLEGLQAGKNYTWNFLFNKKLNSFLNLQLNYLGRKSENSKTIHTGSLQLRAIF